MKGNVMLWNGSDDAEGLELERNSGYDRGRKYSGERRGDET